MKKNVPNLNSALKFSKIVEQNLKFLTVLFSFCLLGLNLYAQQTKVFTTPGTATWIAPCGLASNTITVEAWGGGGAGGAGIGSLTANRSGGGGAGGAYSRHTLTVTPGATYNLNIGSGGAGGNADGQRGGDSWFISNTTMLAKGGGGGEEDNGAGGTILAGSIGNVVVRLGGTGWTGASTGGSGGGGAGTNQNGVNATSTAGGAGGTLGGGSGGDRVTGISVGNDGGIYGGGGGGGRGGFLNRRSGGDGGSGRIIITYNGTADNYCIPNFTTVEPITLVVFEGINNSTSNATGAANATRLPYEKFCFTASVTAGVSYPIQIKGNTAGDFTNHVTVFIDWNQDGSFSAANERYNVGTLTNSTGVLPDIKSISATIAVPGTALPGLTAMRVYKYDPPGTSVAYIANACDNSTYGQVEDYLVQVEGSCQQPTSARANTSTIPAASTITICSGTPVTLRPVGGAVGVGQSWRWYSGACAGAGTALSGIELDGSVSVEPTVTTVYYVRIEGGTCGTTGTCRAVTVNVNQPGTIVHTSGTQNISSACKSTAITSVVYTVGVGATGAGISWSPSPPTGISGAYNSGLKTFTVSGTPAVGVVPGTYTYTITTTGAASPCTNGQITGSMIITDKPSFTYSGGPFTFCLNADITTLTPSLNTGGLTTTFSAPFGLPTGLSINSSGEISGNPTAISGFTNYTIRANNSCGNTDVVISARVISGNAVFNIVPSGNEAICSNSTGVPIGLSDSETGVDYQLYRDLVAIGSAVPGTGNAISFGNNFTIAGTYTIVAINNCPTNMNGSYTLSVTPNPTSTIAYPATTFCKSDDNPSPTISVPVTGGTFVASSPNLVFINASTGEINLTASSTGTYSVRYRIAAAGGCAEYYSPSVTITIANGLNTYTVSGGGAYCTGNGGLPISINGSQNGVTYQLWRDGAFTGTVVIGAGPGFSFPNQTIAGNYGVVAISGGCIIPMNGTVEIIENPNPAAISITQPSPTMCQGSIQPLTATLGTPSTTANSLPFSSGIINQTIPDNSATGTFYEFKVAGIPAGATITSVALDFNIAHGRIRDLTLNLKGPNGNVLNIANAVGLATSANFGTGTSTGQRVVVNSASGNPINTATHPYSSGPYAPHGAGNVAGVTSIPEDTSNVASFSGLYGGTAASANGNWFFTVRDKTNGTTAGALKFCQLVITYTVVNNSTPVTWSPPTDLYTDPGAMTPYVSGTAISRVYVKPATAGPAVIYTATSGNGLGCFATATTSLNVTASPNLLMKANYCAVPGKVRIVAVSNVPIASGGWLWNTGSQGTIANDSSYIDVDVAGTYYVSAKAASGSCNGSGVMSIAQELVTNGNFEAGNTGFTTGYAYQAAASTLITQNPPNEVNPLWGEGTYGVGTDGKYYHNYFFGYDHTFGTGTGNFMLINGVANDIVWENEAPVTVIPNTNYYFSGWVLSLNDAGNDAELKFRVNNVNVGISAIPDIGTPGSSAGNNKWKKFHGTWNSGSATTAIIQIVNLNGILGGNDFGLDDISFGTLTTFFSIVTPPASSTQTGVCQGSPIADVIYEIGGDGNAPTIAGTLPTGVTGYWNGRTYRISGTPTQTGNFTYNITSTGCAAQTRTVTINVIPASYSGIFASSIVSACYQTGGSINVSGSVGTTYTWQSSTTGSGGWTNIVGAPNAATYNYPALTNEMHYRVIARNTAACASSTSAPVKVGLRNLWTGKLNDDWESAANWSDEQLPTLSPCFEARIPTLSSKPYPILTGASSVGVVGDLIVEPGANVQVLNNATLKIAGLINTPTAAITANNATIELNGTAPQAISGSSFVGKNIKNLVISNNVNVSSATNDTLNILEALSFGTVSGKIFNSNDNVTLRSTATRTAAVGVVENGNSVTGKFNVERYLKAFRGWRFLATPVKGGLGTATVTQSWREGGATFATPNGYGLQLTGLGGTANGFDASSAAASMKWYDSTSNNYIPVTNAGSTIANTAGYMVYVRGDRSVSSSNPVSNPTNLRIKGEIRTGTQTYPVGAGKTISMGNPYPSALDMEKVLDANLGMANSYVAWDPSIGGMNAAGGYQAISGLNEFEATAAGAGSAFYTDSGVYKNIQSGQAIYLQNFSGSVPTTLTITESMKASGSTAAISRGSNTPSDRNYMRLKLFNDVGVILDGNAVVFDDEFSPAIDKDDAIKFANSGENFGILRSSKKLAVEARGRVVNTDTIFYNMSNLKVANYKLAVAPKNFNDPMLTAFMVDKFLNTSIPVSITDSSFINFTVTSAAASRAADRFMMVFSKSVAGPLPVTIVSIAANRNADRSVAVTWKVESEINMLKYEVERSADGATFQSILTTAPTAVNGGTASYLQTDLSPLAADNFYRIKALSINGLVQYSAIVKVTGVRNTASSIAVNPNPVENKQMNIAFLNQSKGRYSVELVGVNGQVVYKSSIVVNNANYNETINLSQNLAAGRYELRVIADDGKATNQAIFIN